MKVKAPLIRFSLRLKFIGAYLLLASVSVFLFLLTVGLDKSWLTVWLQIQAHQHTLVALLIFEGVFVVWLYWETVFPIKRLLTQFEDAVYKKQLFIEPQLKAGQSLYAKLVLKIKEAIVLMKDYDTMKTSRISLEVNSLKLLMNHVSEGVMLINQNKIITHVNHQAEQLLGLIPDESVGELVSRYIADQELLLAIDQVMESQKKVSDLHVNLLQKHPTDVFVFPVKNKFGELIRLLVLFKNPEEKQQILFEDE